MPAREFLLKNSRLHVSLVSLHHAGFEIKNAVKLETITCNCFSFRRAISTSEHNLLAERFSNDGRELISMLFNLVLAFAFEHYSRQRLST